MIFRPHDRTAFLVQSRSEPDSGDHIVDIEDRTCSCRGYEIRKTCEHLTELMSQTQTETPPTENAELELASDAPDIDKMKRANPEAAFDKLSQEITPILEQSKALTVADANKLAVVKVADEYRKDVKKLRCAVEAHRKELVADLNKQTKDINGAAGKLWDICEKEEERLLEIIEHGQREVERVQAEKRTARTAELTPFISAPISVDLGVVTDEHYAAMLQDAKDACEMRRQRAEKEKAELEAKEKAEAEERERVRLEVERLKKEAAEREAVLEEERRKAAEEKRIADEKLAAERKAAEDAAKLAKQKADAAAKAALEKARKEREEIEAKAKAEREAAEAVARKEREEAAAENARLAKIAEEQRQKAAEVARIAREATEKAEREEAARKAEEARLAAAPDKEKLMAFAETIRILQVPQMVTERGVQISADIDEQLGKMAKWVEKKAAEL